MGRMAIAGAGVVAALCAGPARADETGDRMRALMEKVAPSVVTIRAVIKREMSFGGRSHSDEHRAELQAVAVTADGLLLTHDGPFANREGGADFSMTSSVQSLKVVFEREEKEYDGFLVATDKELHLAFLQVEGLGDRKLPVVVLEGDVKPGIGDSIVGVARLGKGFDYTPYVELGRVGGRITKPRPAWLVMGNPGSPGLPLYALGGELIGVLTHVESGMRADEEDGWGGGGGTFLVPAKAVRAPFEQAKVRAVELIAERAKSLAEKKDDGAKPEGEAKKDEPGPGDGKKDETPKSDGPK